jgi:pimeloyl-ACP methyl ester carboxylesterase
LLGKLLLGLIPLTLGLAAAGAIYEAVASTRDADRYPPPGQLIDVGGYRVHVLCMGQGSPTVLLDAWAGGWTTEWQPVQPALAQKTRVCAWDRAGSGWSDLGPHNHSPRAYAAELSALVRAAHIDGPYVLVAASYGGRVARLFTNEHPDDVRGVVFVDAVHEDAFSEQDIANQQQESTQVAIGNWVLSRLGIGRLLGPELSVFVDGPVAYTIPESTRQLISVISLRPKNLEGNSRLGEHHRDDDDVLRAAGSLGDRPVVVLTSTAFLERLERWSEAQGKLAALSSRGEQQILEGSHLIAWQHPDALVAAVQRVI